MKVPLNYQVSEYDCGTTTLVNALSYLFDREDIPIELVKAIHRYTLDALGESGVIGEGGTSREAVDKLTHWIKRYINNEGFNLEVELLEQEEVNLESMRKCLNNNGVIIARCYQECEHYVLITKIDDNFAYMFDPYYVSDDYYVVDTQVANVLNQPFTHNRVVKIQRLFNESRQDYSLMEVEKREVLLLRKI